VNISIDMHEVSSISGLLVTPCPSLPYPPITFYRLYVSMQADDWSRAKLVSYGTWPEDATVREARFQSTPARYLRLVAMLQDASQGIGVSQISVMTLRPDVNQVQAQGQGQGQGQAPMVKGKKAKLHAVAANGASTLGQWGTTISLPLVPVSVALLPSNSLLLWSAFANTAFDNNVDYTQTALLDLGTMTSTQSTISNTKHQMFCPGTALLPDGRVLVNGGSTSAATSIYQYTSNAWAASAPMNIPRGYMPAVTLSTGDVFTLGGSWSGGYSGKKGELWSAGTSTWKTLPGVPAEGYILTKDPAGRYKSQK
jgi:galactose oxidase